MVFTYCHLFFALINNEALEQYFDMDDRAKNAEIVVELLQDFNGMNLSLSQAWEVVERERKHDRA